MTLLSGGFTLLLHIALLAVAAPTLAGTIDLLAARLAGQVGPSPLQLWRDLRRLLRKQTIVAESASPLPGPALAASAAAVAVAACLVPSFALGMALAPFADLVVIAGLLLLSRAVLALAALDAGTAMGGMAASRTVWLGCLAEPALLGIVLPMALVAGSSNLDLIGAMQAEAGLPWRAAVGVGFVAMLLVALAETMRREPVARDFSGRDLALVELTASVRVLVWLNLVGAAFFPLGMAHAEAGPIEWLIGIAAWLARTLLLAVMLAGLRAMLGRLRLRHAMQTLGLALLFGMLAAILLFAGMATA